MKMKKHFKKNRLIYTVILASFFLIGVITCKKETSYPDYRLKYCGNFYFKNVNWYTYITGGGGSHSDSLVGVISILNHSDSLIFIRYRKGVNNTICNGDSVFGAYLEPRLFENGNLSYDRVYNCSANSSFTGSFHGLDTVLIYIKSGGIAVQYGDNIIGVRIK